MNACGCAGSEVCELYANSDLWTEMTRSNGWSKLDVRVHDAGRNKKVMSDRSDDICMWSGRLVYTKEYLIEI